MKGFDIARTPLISDIEPGLLQEGYFLLKKIHLNISKKKKPFIRAVLADKSGHLPAVFFESAASLKKLMGEIDEGDIVKISGIVEEFQDVLQLKLLKIERSDPENFELERFWKRTPHDRRVLFNDLTTLVDTIKHTALKSICKQFLSDKEFVKLFLDAPASRQFHHPYIGGLLEHTLNVMKIADSYAAIYPEADRDLMLAGAFTHDIGKISEYEYLTHEIEYTTEARLKSHVLLGYERLRSVAMKTKIDENTRLKLEHIMISHRGKKAWGAITEPMFLEAWLIHSADMADSNQFVFSDLKREYRKSKNINSGWSSYVSYLNREIYLG